MTRDDRAWLAELQKACALPIDQAPHIGPPLLTRLVDGLIAQQAELDDVDLALGEAVGETPRGKAVANWIGEHYGLYMENQRLRETMTDLLDNHCSRADFRNGVTDGSGTMDEGDVLAGAAIQRARAALIAGSQFPELGL